MKKLLLILILMVAAVPAFATKRIIVIQQSTNGAQVCYAVADWYVITSGAQSQTAGSKWPGASAAENTAIQNGSILEEINTTCFPVGQDVTSIKSVLLMNWTVRNTQINGIGPAQFQGVFNDSITGWSA